MRKNILIVTGELSGDMHGAILLKEIKKIKPEIIALAIGQKNLKEAGAKIIFNSQNWGVMGIFDIFFWLPSFYNVLRKIKKLFIEKKIDIVILIDFYGFNLRVAKIAKQFNLKTVYYIPPSLWGRKRYKNKALKTIKYTDKIISILPQEYKLYKKFTSKVEYVGHPQVEIVKAKKTKEEFYNILSQPLNKKIIGILPGSRKKEIEGLLPLQLKVAKKLSQEFKDLYFVISAASDMALDIIKNIVSKENFEIKILKNINYEIMAHSCFLWCCSGTATLEAAILDTPMIILYKISPLSEKLFKYFVSKDLIGLPNIIAGKKIVPELFKNKDINFNNIYKLSKEFLTSKEKLISIKRNLYLVKNKLQSENAALKAAKIICDY